MERTLLYGRRGTYIIVICAVNNEAHAYFVAVAEQECLAHVRLRIRFSPWPSLLINCNKTASAATLLLGEYCYQRSIVF